MKENNGYTREQTADAERLISAFQSVPKDKRSLVALMTEAFINGMKAQESLAEPGRA